METEPERCWIISFLCLSELKKVLGAAYQRLARTHRSGFYSWLRTFGAKETPLAKLDEIFVDLYPIYEDLDNYVLSGEDSYRWSALRSTVRAVRTGQSWSDGFRESSGENLGKVRDLMSKRLVPAIASSERQSLGFARDALESFLTYLVDSSSAELKSIVRMFQSLGFPADN